MSEEKVKARRLISNCCGMVVGEIYDAIKEGNYIKCRLPSGEWTSSHFILSDNETERFFDFPNWPKMEAPHR